MNTPTTPTDLATEVWVLISPTRNEGGLLCLPPPRHAAGSATKVRPRRTTATHRIRKEAWAQGYRVGKSEAM